MLGGVCYEMLLVEGVVCASERAHLVSLVVDGVSQVAQERCVVSKESGTRTKTKTIRRAGVN